MNKFRKAISVGMSAALLASLFTVIAASSALAAATPLSGPVGGGTTVAITGTGFTVATVVTITQVDAAGTCDTTPFTVVPTTVDPSGTSLTFVSPSATGCGGEAGTGIYNVTTTVAGTATASTTFTYSPTVTAIAPITGVTAGGTAVTITGTGFFTGATVAIGGSTATSVVVVSATSITAVTGAHATGLVNVVVTNTNTTSGTLVNGYRYSDTGGTAPTVTLVTPATGSTAGGTSVTITGTNFGAGASVTFGGTAATGVALVSSTSLIATTPAHVAGLVDVVVTNADGLSGTGTGLYTYTGAPPILPPSTTTDYTFTATGAGSVPTTGTSSVVSIAVGEHIVNGWDVAGNTLTFTLQNAGATWTGTPAISGAPTSLGTFTVSGVDTQVLTVSFTASNTAQVENFTIGGMTIDTDGTPTGPLRVIVAKTAGGGAGTIPFGTGTASGVLTLDEAAGETSLGVTCDDGSFDFHMTDADNGNLSIAAPAAETRSITSPPDPCAGGATLIVPALTSFHALDTVVTQSVSIQGLIVIGTVVPTLTETAVKTTAAVQPGENNQVLTSASVMIDESSAGTLAKNSVVTFKLDTAGVVFSTAPTATPAGTNLRLNDATVDGFAVPCALSFDRTSCTVTVTKASTAVGGGTITLASMIVDVAATVAQGAKVGVDVTTSPAVPVNVDSKTIFTINRFVVGVSAQPTIFINENDQQSGMLTLTEQAAGLLTAAAGTNYLGLCLSSGESFTRAPWAVVTAGNLLLRSGAVGATSVQGSIVAGTGNRCVEWIVYSKSTTASTIEIRGSDASNVVLPSGATNGPRLSVPATAAPGTTLIRVLNGSQADVEANAAAALVTIVSNAVRAYRNQPVVAAVNQPVIMRGAIRAALGDITITETSAGQLKAGERIQFCIQALATPAGNNAVAQFKGGNTADNPVVSTNSASGLLAHLDSSTITGLGQCFTIVVDQQATGTLGAITVQNMWVFVLGDAPNANVLVRVNSTTAGVTLDQIVSPARIGTTTISGSNGTRLGVTQTGAFTISTKVAKVGKYVTYRFDFGVAAAGQVFVITGATKTGNDWSAFTTITSRRANASGVVYYYIRQYSATWRSYRAAWSNGGVITLARQSRWIP